jgi:hypothetical protein
MSQGERIHLAIPHAAIQREAVDEHEERACSRHLIEQACAGHRSHIAVSSHPAHLLPSIVSHRKRLGEKNPFLVDIMDSAFCTSGPTNPRTPGGPGAGNLDVTVTIS